LGSRKGIRPVKTLGRVVGGGGVNPVEVAATLDCQYLCLHYLPLLHKNQEEFSSGTGLPG